MTMKIKLFDIKLKNEPIIFNDPIFELTNKDSEIKNEVNSNSIFTKLLYFNKKKIHSYLYENDDVINLNNRLLDNQFRKLSFNFYLVLLIQDVNNFIYYNYSFLFIKNMHNINNNNNFLYKIIKSKIILELLYYFEGIDIYEEDEHELKRIENENKLIINNNIYNLKRNNIDLNENDIIEKKIEDIYSEIILSLIKNDKLSDSIYTNGIIYSLDI